MTVSDSPPSSPTLGAWRRSPFKKRMSQRSERVKTWRTKAKLRALAAMGGKCVLCAYDRCTRSLTFHHLDPSQKDFPVNCARARSWASVVIELRKCVLLCHNCHCEVHEGMTTIPTNVRRFDETYVSY